MMDGSISRGMMFGGRSALLPATPVAGIVAPVKYVGWLP